MSARVGPLSWCIPKSEKVAPAEGVTEVCGGGCHAFLAWEGMHHDNGPTLFSLVRIAREMRREPEKSEALLWAQLRGSKLGVRFRRQHPFPLGFIVDFFASSARLVVEVDGTVHMRPGARERDAIRQAALEAAYGVRFLRLSAKLVERDTFAAVALVRATLR